MRGNSPPPRSSWSWSYRIRRNSENEVRPIVQLPGPNTSGRRASQDAGTRSVSLLRKSAVPTAAAAAGRPEVTTESETWFQQFKAKRRESLDMERSGREESRERGRPLPQPTAAAAQGQGGGVPDHHQSSPAQAQPIIGIGGGTAKNNPSRRSMPHPPLSYYNRGRLAHQRAYSASTVTFRSSSVGHDDLHHLRPPALSNIRSSSVGPPTAAVPSPFGRASLPPGGGTMPFAMHPPGDQEFVMRTQRASARIQEVMSAHPNAPPAPKVGGGAGVSATEYVPMAYANHSSSLGMDLRGSYHQQRPRALSNSSSSTLGSSMVSARESFESRPPSSSLGSSRTSLDSSPSFGSPGFSPRTPPVYSYYQAQNAGNSAIHYPWQRPALIKTRRKAQPGELFAALPAEVLELILDELRNLHFQPGSISCATCWMRDVCSVALSARKFLKYAREALYQHIYLVGADNAHMKKRTKVNHGSRLILLRRTLRSNLHIAVIVRSLKPPVIPSSATTTEYNDLVASVVMACPNLERLVGFYPTYNHSFQRLFHALSSRPKLKEMTWIIDPVPPPRTHHRAKSSSGGRKNWAVQEESGCSFGPQGFLDFHRGWLQLTTLAVHGHPGATLSPSSVMEGALRSLPSLQNLILTHLPPTSFNDANLLSVPPLKKLSLSHLPGVTTAGLSAMATRSASASITTLTLIHINVETLPALARILSNLTSLQTFSIVQAYAPIMPTDELIWLFPYLASQSLRKLHWDIPYLPTRATTADNILAKSISAGGFPALRVLRAPNDPEGVFQALCRPVERADLPTDRFRTGTSQLFSHNTQGHGRTASAHTTPHGSRPGTGAFGSRPFSSSGANGSSKPNSNSAPTSPLFPPDSLMLPRDNSNLHLSRLAAQARLEVSRRFPRFFINIVDENDTIIEQYGVGAFLGSVESSISYFLKPDPGATDEGGGLVTVSDLLGDCGEALVLEPRPELQKQNQGGEKDEEKEKEKRSSSRSRRERKKVEAAELEMRTRREGCTGRWNTMSGMVMDRKDKERWWHTERGRWRGVALS